MSKNYLVGFPRIGEQRELKVALEAFWSNKSDFSAVETVAHTLKTRHWNYQKDAGIDFISSNDFSYYDTMLDMIVLLGAIPERFRALEGEERYFSMARGNKDAVAMQMTKWFNTNYHYIVPELSDQTPFELNATKLIQEYLEAKEAGIKTKINLIGPMTFLSLSKYQEGHDPLTLLDKVLPIYTELLEKIATLDDDITVQFDEPIFATDLTTQALSLIKPTYDKLAQVSDNLKIVVSSYFEHATQATAILVHTPIWGLHLDFLYGPKNLQSLELIAKHQKVLIAGVIDGRNIWRIDLDATLKILTQIKRSIATSHILIGSSCSLLHTPFTLRYETALDPQIKAWLSYSVEKLDELSLLSKHFFNQELNAEEKALTQSITQANQSRKSASIIHDKAVQSRLKTHTQSSRNISFEERIKIQRAKLQYQDLATTSIGSFPQTPEVRAARRDYKHQVINQSQYDAQMRLYIDDAIKRQEELGLEVLVHGEPERNDMVEYFAQFLNGYGFSQNGWVQSYGSRCVKPPFIYGDISRIKPMTVAWSTYAQSKTDKIMKGMLTGPVTILNWSFVRDDLPRSLVSKQIALALYDEIDDLQNAGIKIIQVDEAAFKEGYPLRKSEIPLYEKWAVENFKLSVAAARPETQIHTHMCYSQFNDIIHTIEAMDADVISIETARSGNRLLQIFKESGYKQEVGPGVYDIHSPRIPSVEEIEAQIYKLLEVLPKEQLWINPDCGLKTRRWEEVMPSLANMVEAVKRVRKNLENKQ